MQLSQLCHCILKYKVHAQTEPCRSTSEFILSTILGLHSYVPNFLFCHDLFYFSSNKCQEKIMWENSQERKVKLLILSFYTGHLCFGLYLHLLKAELSLCIFFCAIIFYMLINSWVLFLPIMLSQRWTFWHFSEKVLSKCSSLPPSNCHNKLESNIIWILSIPQGTFLLLKYWCKVC